MNSLGTTWEWVFLGFRDRRGEHIQKWYDDSLELQAEFDLVLQTLRTRAPGEWYQLGRATKLKGKSNVGLLELRFRVERVEIRPIGFFGIGQQRFTILTVATKHEIEAHIELARERKTLVENNPGNYSYESECLRIVTR